MKTKTNVRKIEVLKPTNAMMRARKGFIGPLVGVLGLGVVIGALGYGAYSLYDHFIANDDSEPQTLSLGSKTIEGGKVITTELGLDASQCGLNQVTSADFVVINPLDVDGTPTYPAVSLKIKGADSAALKTYTTTGAATFASSSASINCPSEFTVYALADTNTTASGKWEFTALKPNFDEMLEIEQLDHVTVYAYDNINKGFVYDSADASATDGEELTSTVTFKSTAGNTTAYAMGTNGKLDMSISAYTAEAQRSWGDLRNWIIVDADKTDYAQPSVAWNGVALACSDVAQSAMPTADQGYISGYEYACLLPEDIDAELGELRLKVNAKSGQNPDVDINVRFVAESYYQDGVDVKRGIFNSGGTELLMSEQKITIDIS